LIRWIKFTVAGTAGFAVQIGTLAVLSQITALHYLVATAIAVELAIVCNFAWHERWTWRDRLADSARDRWTRLLRFNALTAVTSIAGSVALTAVFVESASLPPIAANIASVIALGLVNFLGANTLVFRAATIAAVVSVASGASAAEPMEAVLQAKTAKDFSRYVAAVEARAARDLTENAPFLDVERQPPAQLALTLAALRKGEIIVTRGVARDDKSSEIEVDGGLINHWRGTVFVPDVTLDELLKVLQEPQTDKHKQEEVLSSRVVSRDGDKQKVFLRVRRTKWITAVFDTDYDVEYRRLSPDKALSNSLSTRIVEIENAGTPRERALPEGNDRGLLWRLNTYWRYKQQDGGVLVEIESVTLSRSLPPIVGSLIRPIVKNTARESMTRTLAGIRARFAD
jgi:putative flippase GtrA